MVCQFCFGCHAGELHSGLSGWMNGDAEVLELLAFGELEQQDAHCFQIWRPLSGKFFYPFRFERFIEGKEEKNDERKRIM